MTDNQESTRKSAEERRDDIIEIAIQEFAKTGFVGTSTQTISDVAGVSQPYLFKLFGNKTSLFLAAHDRVWARLDAVVDEAMGDEDADIKTVSADAYSAWLTHRVELMFMIQVYAAANDPVVREHVRQSELAMFSQVLAMMDGDVEEARKWIALGLLQGIGALLDIPDYQG